MVIRIRHLVTSEAVSIRLLNLALSSRKRFVKSLLIQWPPTYTISRTKYKHISWAFDPKSALSNPVRQRFAYFSPYLSPSTSTFLTTSHDILSPPSKHWNFASINQCYHLDIRAVSFALLLMSIVVLSRGGSCRKISSFRYRLKCYDPMRIFSSLGETIKSHRLTSTLRFGSRIPDVFVHVYRPNFVKTSMSFHLWKICRFFGVTKLGRLH